MSNPSPHSAFLNKKIQADCGRRAKRGGEARASAYNSNYRQGGLSQKIGEIEALIF